MSLLAKTMKIAILVFKCLLVIQIMCAKKKKAGPTLRIQDSTTCDEFSKFARFNPYTMINGTWMVFYYWGYDTSTIFLRFTVPSQKSYDILQNVLEEKHVKAINWTARHFIMQQADIKGFLVETGDRGQYTMYVPGDWYGKPMEPIEVRFKQTGDNKVVGMMICKSKEVFAMSRLKDVPRQNQLQEAAARLNYRGRGGKSYLYQGHHWMPIPEQDERTFWSNPKRRFMI